MNFLDTYGITGTGTSTPPTGERQPEQSLNEEVLQVIGQLGRFWGGFRKQSGAALSTARHDLGQVVTQAQREIEKLTTGEPQPTAESADDARTTNVDGPVDTPSGGTTRPTSTEPAGEAGRSLPATTEAQSLFARLQSSIPPDIVSTVQAQLPDRLRNAQHIDLAQLSSEFQRMQGVTRAHAEEYVHRSEALLREVMKEAGDVFRDAVKIIPPEGEATEPPVVWDGSDIWMLPGLAAHADGSAAASAAAKGKGKEVDSGPSSGRPSEDARRAVATRAESLLKQLKSNPEILKIDPAVDTSKDAYEAWADASQASGQGFGTKAWNERVTKALSDPLDGATLQTTFDGLVPSIMPEEVFWVRYFFRVHQIEAEENRRKALLQATAENEEDFSWEDDEEEVATSAKLLGSSQHTLTPAKMGSAALSPPSSHAQSPGGESSEESYDVVSGCEEAKKKGKKSESEEDSDWEPRLWSRSTAILALRLIWILVVVWCEFGVFFYSLSDCRWPDKILHSSSEVQPTQVLLIADARLRNPSVREPWFGYYSNTAYLRKSWRAVSLRLRPDMVIFLGDTFASSRYVTSEAEYDRYYRAFVKTFPLDPSIPLYLTPGNNDIGLGDSPSFSQDARLFFEKRFGPLNRVVSISGHQLVLLDAPGLVEEDYRRHAYGQTYDHWTPLRGGPIEFVRSISDQGDGHTTEPKILLSHIPLSRPSSKSCGPLREKGSIRPSAGHGYQSMLGKQTTEFLLKTLRPSVVFSADNRDYCDIVHDIPGSDPAASGIREVTVKSFSPSRHIRRPGFQLLSLVPPSSSSRPTFADVPCHLPDTRRVFHSIYIPCFVLTAFVLLYLNIRSSGHRRRLSSLSPISLTRHRGSCPEPESAIWTTRTPVSARLQPSPIAPLPLSSRTLSAKSIPSYRASPATTPQMSPLLSPITLFPSGDEGDVEEDHIGSSHYLRRDLPHHSPGWQGEHDVDDVARDREAAADRPHARAARISAPYFLPPPLSHHARARWSWSFGFRGRRRRVTFAVPDWGAWWRWLSDASMRRGRGLVWRFASDCVIVALPAVVTWSVISWWFF